MKRALIFGLALVMAIGTLTSCFTSPESNGATVNEAAWRAAFVLGENLTVEYDRVDTESKDFGVENEFVYRRNIMMRNGGVAYISLPGSGDVFYLSKKAGEHEVTKRFYALLEGEGAILTVIADRYADFRYEDGVYILRGAVAGAKLDGKDITEVRVTFDNGRLVELVCVGKVYSESFFDIITVKDIGKTVPLTQD